MLVVSKKDRHSEWRPNTILGSPDRCRLDRSVASHRSGPRYYLGTTPGFPIKRMSLREADSVRRVGLPGAATHELRMCCPLGNASRILETANGTLRLRTLLGNITRLKLPGGDDSIGLIVW
jgi:hypothetical protein